MKKIFLIIISSLLVSCQNNVFTNIAKTDIDIVTEIHVNNAKENIENLIIKLYKINPKYINKNEKFDSVSQVIIDIFKEVDINKKRIHNINNRLIYKVNTQSVGAKGFEPLTPWV